MKSFITPYKTVIAAVLHWEWKNHTEQSITKQQLHK